jgi:DNA-directed RNA polymerase subunit RPC12/RpoP
MNKIIQGLLVFVGVVILFLGLIFIVASGTENILTGSVMVLVAVGIFVFTYYTEKIQASKPTLVSQTFNVKMEGSGKLQEKEMKCRTCGAPITEKDLKIVQGGVMVTCSYCGAAYSLQEEPKW